MFGQLTPVGTEGLPLTGKVRRAGTTTTCALPTTERGTMILVGAVREQLSIPVDRGVSGDLRFGVLIAV